MRSFVITLLIIAALLPLTAHANESALSTHVDQFSQGDNLERIAAAKALGTLGADAMSAAPALIAAWNDDSSDVRRSAVKAVIDIGAAIARQANRNKKPVLDATPLTDALIKVIQSPNRTQRQNALAVIKRMGHYAKATYPYVLQLMELDDGALRVEAIFSLMNSRHSDVRQVYSDALDYAQQVAERTDENGERAYRIIMILLTAEQTQFTDSDIPRAITVFTDALNHPQSSLRTAGARGLGLLRKQAEPAIPDLIKTIDDDVFNVHEAALKALGDIGQPALPAIADLLNRKEADIRRFAARQIDKAGQNAKPHLTAIIAAAETYPKDTVLAVHALNTIGDSGDSGQHEFLLSFFDSDNVELRSAAIVAYSKTIDTHLKQALSLIKKNPTAASAGQTFLQRREQAYTALEILNQHIAKDNDPRSREQATQWLGELASRLDESWKRLNSDNGKALPRLTDEVDHYQRLQQQVATQLLARIEQEQDREVKITAMEAFGRLKTLPERVLPALVKQFADEDKVVRDIAVRVYGQYGTGYTQYLRPAIDGSNAEAAKLAKLALLRSLQYQKDKDALTPHLPFIREQIENRQSDATSGDIAIRLTASMTPAAQRELVPLLIQVMQQPGAGPQTVRALGEIGEPAQPALPKLIGFALAADSKLPNYDGTNAINQIVKSMIRSNQPGYISELKDFQRRLTESKEAVTEAQFRSYNALYEELDLSIAYLETVADLNVKKKIEQWLQENLIIAIAVPLYLLWAGFWWLMSYLKPTLLLKINRALETFEFRLPTKFGSYVFPLRYILFVGFLQYHPRVLDAWVNQHINTVRRRFNDKATVADRQVHVPLPVKVGNDTVADFGPSRLRKIFANRLSFLLIWGEGGSGKTSLACWICRNAIAEDPEERLAPYLMIPVILEREQSLRDGGDDSVLADIGQQLQDLCDLADPIESSLLNQLLRAKRIVVIVDHFSEMSDTTRHIVQKQLRQRQVRALIVTSRIEEDLEGFSRTVVQPIRIGGNRLSSFMEAYLSHRGVRDLFDDAEFFSGCSHLSTMVGQRDITALFAKLYAEKMIGAKRDISVSELPESIPALILNYINELNSTLTDNKIEDRRVHRIAKRIAWECLNRYFTPAAADLKQVIRVLDGDESMLDIEYLEQRLRLIHILQPAQDQLAFLLDPIAEYLAAMYLVDQYGSDEAQWQQFLVTADNKEGTPERIRGFLLAVYDCCQQQREQPIPAAITNELQARLQSAAV